LAGVSELFSITAIGHLTPGNVIMILIGCILIYLGIEKRMEPLLLVPIGLGAILANIPMGGIADFGETGGILGIFLKTLIGTEIVPLLIFLGIGALTDFGPLIANPKTFLLGAAAQIGIFIAFIFALLIGFTPQEAASIGIIGGADGPTTIYTTTILAPQILAATAVAAYSYMSLVPIIQPPVIKALTTEEERKIRMRTLRPVSKKEKIIFPIVTIIVSGLLVPKALPLIGMLMAGNVFRESGVTDRLAKGASEELLNIMTIILGLTVGSTMKAESFLNPKTVMILVLGVIAFAAATAGGVLLAKLMNLFVKEKINPMIGAAGVSAVPMSARVVQKLALKEDYENHLLMHAMGPNVAGVIGSATAAGILIHLLG
jgi:oxaloacetate decarboxylase beta subunit